MVHGDGLEPGLPADERHAQPVGQGCRIVVMGNEAPCQQHLVHRHAAGQRFCLDGAERGRVDERTDEKPVLLESISGTNRRGAGRLGGVLHPR